MRTIELTRDEAELLVCLIDDKRPEIDGRLILLAEAIREKFGMVSYEDEQEFINTGRRPTDYYSPESGDPCP